MGNVNMESDQIHYRNNSKPSVHTVGAAIDALYTSNASINQDIIDLTAAMTAKADKIDIAPTFSAEGTYYIGDLVFQSGRLWRFTANHTPGEWNQEEVEAINIDIAIKEAGGGSGGYTVKTKNYTGNGSADLVIDFGDETPVAILAIFATPGESVLTANYEQVLFFVWGQILIPLQWSVKNGNLPNTGGNGGLGKGVASYNGNIITLTSQSSNASCNYEAQKYTLYYLV